MNETTVSRYASDQDAARLCAEYGDRIYRYCLGQLRSREDAEDAVQNTFLRVTTAMRKGVVPEFEGPWLYKIAHNVCLSRRLGSTRRARVETPADIDALGDRAAAYAPDADELFGLDDALADMPPNLRRPLLLREWQGMSYGEIAEALGVSHSAVETLIFRARRHLAQALTDSARKSGRAVASLFPFRWLVNVLRGLGGGTSGAGIAAGTVALVVAIGGGVAIDVATQAHASRTAGAAFGTHEGQAVATPARATAAHVSASAAQAVSASSRGAGGAHTAAAGAAAGARSGAAGAAAASGSGLAGTSTVASSSSGGAAKGVRSKASGSAPSKAGSGGAASRPAAGNEQGKRGRGSKGSVEPPSLPPAPSVPDPASVIPPVVPGIPGLPDPRGIDPPTLPPPPVSLPPVPPVPPIPR